MNSGHNSSATPGLTVLVAGSTGFAGGLLLQRLVSAEAIAQITCLVRREPPASLLLSTKVKTVITDFQQPPASLENAYDAVFLCLGTIPQRAGSKENYVRVEHDFAIAVANWAAERSARVCAYISSAGAREDSGSLYLRTKALTERDLSKIGFDSLHIFRPAFLTGRPQIRWLERVGATACKALYALGLGPKSGAFKPISGALLADAMAAVIRTHVRGTSTYHYPEMLSAIKS